MEISNCNRYELERIESMVNENYDKMKKEVISKYEDFRTLELSEIKYLSGTKLSVERRFKKRKGIRIELNSILKWILIGYNKNDKKYYTYFNKFLEEAGIKE